MFIYGLQDPITNQLHYVGVTKYKNLDIRLGNHIKDSKRHNPEKYDWIKSLELLGYVPQIFLIEEVLESNWEEAEKFWISYFRSIGSNLFNRTEGGDGIPNPSKEIRESIGKSNKLKLKGKTYEEIHGKEKSQELKKTRGAYIKGKKWEDVLDVELVAQLKSNIRLVHSGKKQSKEIIDKRRKKLPKGDLHWTRRLGYPQSAIDKMKATKAANPNSGMRNKKHSTETKLKMSESAIRRFQNK